MTTPDIGETSDGYHTFNELYKHRHALFLALLRSCSAWSHLDPWMSRKHDDGTSMDGWFIAGIKLKDGMISYHIPDRLWDDFSRSFITVLERAPKWDGHTSNDVVKRLMNFSI